MIGRLMAVLLMLGLASPQIIIRNSNDPDNIQPVVTCTTTTADASRTAVAAAITAAATNDIVCVPSGSATWSSSISVTKEITIKGAGIGNTVITSSISGSFDACTSALICYSAATPGNHNLFRITGFTFDGNWSSGCVALYNNSTTTPSTKVRADHNRFTNCGKVGTTQRAITADGLTFGVIDHNVFLNNQKTFDEELQDDFGWAIAVDMGGPNSMYFEDNTVTNNDSRVSIITSGGQGGRYVFRFNAIDTTSANADNQHLDVHGNLSDRGTVSAEIYNNTITTKTAAWQFLDLRGSTARVFNNAVIKPSSDIILALREEDTGTYPLLDQVKLAYLWKNTYGTTTGTENNMVVDVSQGATYVQADRDFWNYTASFTGASGMGVGVLASRPSTCTTGVGYWATDQGEWNSTNGLTADGALYRCTSTNTWTLYYTPYTYPHPLTAGS